MRKFIIAACLLGLVGILLGVHWIRVLDKAHSTFENYYAFRGCTTLLEKTDDAGRCETTSGQTIKIVKFNDKWYLDGDLPWGANASESSKPGTQPLPPSAGEPADPSIGSITPPSAPVGTTLEIRGTGLVGFEGDVYFFFERSDGKVARLKGVVLTQATGEAIGAQTARVILKEPCQQGETVYGEYSGIPAPCDYVQLTPGVYKVYTTPWGKRSNAVAFTITQPVGVDASPSPSLIQSSEWGVQFKKETDWDITEQSRDAVVLKKRSGFDSGDRITVTFSSGTAMTDTDAKFGPVTYFYAATGPNGANWYRKRGDEMTGDTETVTLATPAAYTADGMLAFLGTSRWKTYIVPLSKTHFMKINITGSGKTDALDVLLKTVKKI